MGNFFQKGKWKRWIGEKTPKSPTGKNDRPLTTSDTGHTPDECVSGFELSEVDDNTPGRSFYKPTRSVRFA